MQILFRAIRARGKHPAWVEIAKEIERTLDTRVKPRMLEYPRKVVASWEHKPDFKARKRVTRTGISLYVYPTGENAKYWQWTSRGTKPHIIEPKRAAALRFPSLYQPKTTPRGPGYKGSGKSSGPIVFALKVHHPGTKARKFEEAWARYNKKWFRKEMENAIRRGARRA